MKINHVSFKIMQSLKMKASSTLKKYYRSYLGRDCTYLSETKEVTQRSGTQYFNWQNFSRKKEKEEIQEKELNKEFMQRIWATQEASRNTAKCRVPYRKRSAESSTQRVMLYFQSLECQAEEFDITLKAIRSHLKF